LDKYNRLRHVQQAFESSIRIRSFDLGKICKRSLGVALFFIVSFGQLLFAGEPKLQKPEVYHSDDDVIGWVMSEKLDGIRGYWDGARLQTRQGRILHPPAWFVQNFPSFELDGELWSKRGHFEFIQSTVMDQEPGKEWAKITYNIFEAPNSEGDFYLRMDKVQKWFEANRNPQVRVIPQVRVESKNHLVGFLNEIHSKGGEGVIVKNPLMPYHTGRSPHVLKVKKFQGMEGVVTAVNEGKGKYKTMMGSLTLALDDGTVFKLGTGFTDQTRKNPPPIGTVVTFKYYGLTRNGIPKFASFLRVRRD